MGKMAEPAAQLEMFGEPCGDCETSRKLAEEYVASKDFAPGSYSEKLKQAFEAGYKAAISSEAKE